MKVVLSRYLQALVQSSNCLAFWRKIRVKGGLSYGFSHYFLVRGFPRSPSPYTSLFTAHKLLFGTHTFCAHFANRARILRASTTAIVATLAGRRPHTAPRTPRARERPIYIPEQYRQTSTQVNRSDLLPWMSTRMHGSRHSAASIQSPQASLRSSLL